MRAKAFQGRILAFTEAAAAELAARMAAARRAGRAVGFQDGMIGASAASGFPIATRNTRPFEAMGLAVVDPWEERHG